MYIYMKYVYNYDDNDYWFVSTTEINKSALN